MKKLRILFLCLCFVGCSQMNPTDAKIKGKKSLEKLAVIFSEIQSADDFKNKSCHLKMELDLLAEVSITLKKNGDQTEGKLSHLQKDTFEKEFKRVMNIPGCKELYEQASIDALYKLDAFERKLRFPQDQKVKKKKIEWDL
ncbi:MAG: hypothetical protein EBU93_02390 [Chlamydiae bacterium]|nr:hypothetical protein [Chlamydiota bacterium]